MHHSGVLLCLALTLFPVLGAGATKAEKKAATLVKQAEKLYGESKYLEAVEALKAADELDPNPKLLYNIARAYDQAGDLSSSLEFYRQYVATERPDPALVKKANLALDRLRALLAKEAAAKQVREAERLRLEEQQRQSEEKARAELQEAQRQRDEYEAREKAEAEAKARSRSRGRTLSYVGAGLTLAGAGAGVYFGLQARASKAAFTLAPDVAAKRTWEAETRSKALIADVGFGVAIAAAVATVVAWPKGSDEPKKEVSVAIVPGPGGAGVAVSF